jgi:hypothetical protein
MKVDNLWLKEAYAEPKQKALESNTNSSKSTIHLFDWFLLFFLFLNMKSLSIIAHKNSYIAIYIIICYCFVQCCLGGNFYFDPFIKMHLYCRVPQKRIYYCFSEYPPVIWPSRWDGQNCRSNRLYSINI